MKDMDAALDRLTRVTTRLSSLGDQEDFEGGDDRILACKALCRFFRVEIKIPAAELWPELPDLVQELLYLSNLRCKEVMLPENWWKKDSGAMMGTTTEGEPVALLPHKWGGYTIYDPRTNRSSRLGKEDAAAIKRLALAVFRPFPPGEVNARTLLAFLAGENIGKEIFIMSTFSLLAGIGAVAPPMVSAQIFDAIVPNTLRGMLFEIVMVLFCFDIAHIGFRAVSNISISRMVTKISLSLEGGIWDRLLGMRLSFFNRYTAGELLQKLQSISRIKALISVETVQTLLKSLFSFVNIIVLARLDRETTAYVLLMDLGLFAVYAVIEYRNFKYHQRYIENENRAAGFNHQALNSIQRIQVSRAEERIYRVWSGFEAEKRYLLGRIKILENLNACIQLFFQTFSTAAVFFLVARKADAGIGVFIAFVATFLLLQGEMLRLLKVLNILPEVVSLCRNASPVLQGEGEYNSQKILPRDMTGALEVNHLSFRYGEFGRMVLQDISFRVEDGQSLGIIGPSGCGKSTLLKALLGFYPLAGGKIYYGGYDLETIELRYLRKRLGVVLQNGMIPLGSLYDILTDSNPHICPEQVADALEKVEMAGEVEALPQGWHTPVEECRFSDGQYQRLMIARTLIKEHPFIFFDEPTSKLDNVSQQKILDHIYQTKATKIIVAQRLATVKGCNTIMVLGKGTVINQGSYDEIMGSDDILKWLS
jgi:ATP-binding cassette subfamily C protein